MAIAGAHMQQELNAESPANGPTTAPASSHAQLTVASMTPQQIAFMDPQMRNYIEMQEKLDGKNVDWMEKVSDEQYQREPSQEKS